MGTIINLSDSSYVYENNKWKRVIHNNGLTLTKTGWKNFNITKHRRGWRNTCSICGNKCVQALGNQYEKICLKCSEDWLKNSIEEMDRIKDKLVEQQQYIKDNNEKLTKIEKTKMDLWKREEILEKLGEEQ